MCGTLSDSLGQPRFQGLSRRHSQGDFGPERLLQLSLKHFARNCGAGKMAAPILWAPGIFAFFLQEKTLIWGWECRFYPYGPGISLKTWLSENFTRKREILRSFAAFCCARLRSFVLVLLASAFRATTFGNLRKRHWSCIRNLFLRKLEKAVAVSGVCAGVLQESSGTPGCPRDVRANNFLVSPNSLK